MFKDKTYSFESLKLNNWERKIAAYMHANVTW